MEKKLVIIAFLFCFSFTNFANEREIVLGQGNLGNGHDQIHVDPPQVTYDDELNELSVYFGSTGTITLEYLDAGGSPYYFVYDENHPGYTYASYSSLPAGYYTITIHSIYGYTYTGNFTVS
jgi:hypothetical protein